MPGSHDAQVPLDVPARAHDPPTLPTTSSATSLRWPPLVTAVPESPPSADATRIGVTTAGIDAQFCAGGPACRILLPLWIGEQESRGRMHLTQLVHLAAAVNRTLVLPNVGKSRLGTCGKWTFEAYYDTGSLARQMREVSGGAGRLMLMDDFKTWIDMRPDAPRGQVLFLQEDVGPAPPEEDATLLESQDGLSLFVDRDTLAADDRRLKNAFCLKTKFRGLQLDQHQPLSMHLTAPDPLYPADVPSGDLFVELLNHLSASYTAPKQLLDVADNQLVSPQDSPLDPDVLLVHWDLRHMPFTAPLPPLDYSAKLWQMTHRLTALHRPYLAVHWRMETVDPAVLPDCAEALVDTLSTLLGDPTLAAGIKSVWLATDVPWSSDVDKQVEEGVMRSPEQRSNTFKAFAKEHFEAIDILKAAFARDGSLEEWTLTGLAEEIRKLRAAHEDDELVLAYEDDVGLLWEDSGIWGILDKMAAMNSTLFVSGARGCGRVRYVQL